MSVEDAARKFRDEMKKLGLGVTIQIDDRDPVVVTEWICPDCRGSRGDAVKPCPECQSPKDAILV